MEQYERKTAEFEDFARFHIQSRSFLRQFCGIYKARLATLKPKALKRAIVKWGKCKVLQIVDLTKEEYEGVQCAIFGTLYKHQELKPSVLKTISEELQAVPQPPRLNFCSPKDSVYLEDDVSRIKLFGGLEPDTLVTGLVCGVLGHVSSDGCFWVDDFCFPGLYLSPLLTTPSSSTNNYGKYILFLSGLDFVNLADCMALQLFKEWVCGMLGNETIQQEAAGIVRIIIAGNSVRGSPETFDRKGYFENKNRDKKFASEAQLAVHRLDKFLSHITQSCSVILMPGEFDPSCHSIPQHPMHRNMFPLTSKHGHFHGATNPWIGKIGSRTVGGSSGEPIMDIMKVSDTESSPIEWLEKTLDWQHFAPTAPDTLAEYPFDDSDPLVMKDFPNIYFAGNMDRYETKLLQGTDRLTDSVGQPIRLVCIPKFSQSYSVVLVDLDSLDTKLISFGTA
ncbi:hypothetical protein TKK_0017055 [Trichogramma kaykai]|uniref:DNA polymerase delta subunit 2 n=1 Tax=Trichogramma kaykai TaxID=54128 RepID=A0ABD2W5U9_9HYME